MHFSTPKQEIHQRSSRIEYFVSLIKRKAIEWCFQLLNYTIRHQRNTSIGRQFECFFDMCRNTYPPSSLALQISRFLTSLSMPSRPNKIPDSDILALQSESTPSELGRKRFDNSGGYLPER